MSKVTLKVKGMMCGHCSASIDKALNALDGVKAQADHVKGQVELELADDSMLDKIKSAIRDLDFEVVE